MQTFHDAAKSLSRVGFNLDQVVIAQQVEEAAMKFLEVMWTNVKPCPELTMAVRKLEECVVWHSKAIASEKK